jgi:aspartyl protease family protein
MRNQRVVVAWSMAVFGLLMLLADWLLKEPEATWRVEKSAQGQTLVLQRASSGHYRWAGQINGVATEFLVDTGAVRTTIAQSLATEAKLQITQGNEVHTASGKLQGGIASANLVLSGGLRIDGLRVGVLPSMPTDPLLGMDVLARLRVQMQGNEMKIWLPNP